MTTLAIPTIHMNGTSRDALFADLCEAIRTLYDADLALARASPSGRDYYPQGPSAISIAMDQHAARLAKLREITKELETIAEAISG